MSGIGCIATFSTYAFAYRAGVGRAGVYRGGVHRGAVYRGGVYRGAAVRRGVAVGVGAAAVGGAYNAPRCGYYPTNLATKTFPVLSGLLQGDQTDSSRERFREACHGLI